MQRPDGLIDFRPKTPGGAKTIAERMRDFRKRHPGYDRMYKAKQRARLKAYQASLVAAPAPAQVEAVPAPVVMTLPMPTYRLALPAPVVDPTMVALNELAAKLKAAKAEAYAPVRRD